MKFAAPLLLLAALASQPSCTTLVNRRDLYSPKEGSGYWTDKHSEYRRGEGIFGISNRHHHEHGEGEGIFGVSRNNPRAEFSQGEDDHGHE